MQDTERRKWKKRGWQTEMMDLKQLKSLMTKEPKQQKHQQQNSLLQQNEILDDEDGADDGDASAQSGVQRHPQLLH